MQTQQLTLSPAEAKQAEATYRVVRRSVDARQRQIKVNLTLLTDEDGTPIPHDAPIPLYEPPVYSNVRDSARQVIIVGAGPAGLFAALTLLEHGIRPIVLERGKQVSDRKRDIALLNRNQGLNSESNYCFGEGGAGTFSDGKLFSRSKKRGNMQRVMELFHYFGAPDTVLYETHAHIGSDRLPAIIRAMRECIIRQGGEVHFGCRVTAIGTNCVHTEDKRCFTGEAVVLAIGHSAHDTYRMLDRSGIAMEAKGFALGVRVEHPQQLINDLIYHHNRHDVPYLGNASYSLVTQVAGRGVYSFCMCPGGHIVPAGSSADGCVVNGMSASHRNSPYANSGIVVEVPPHGSAMEALDEQEQLEALAKQHGGPEQQAPAQRLRDFVEGRASDSLPPCSYLPGCVPSRLDLWLPSNISQRLRQGFRDFDRKYPGFLTNDALILGVESRSSSPIRILRDAETMQSVSHPYLYPVGEGAGYAGGITSSALDGINAALRIAHPA